MSEDRAEGRGAPASAGRRGDLVPDCAKCFGLCCVALPFSASADFPVDKPAGVACGHLRADLRCGIHDRLAGEGYTGCTVFECFGAGQRVSQVTFGGRDWRAEPAGARAMFEVFPVMHGLHELLWYLTEAIALRTSGPVRADLRRALERIERLADGTPGELLALDLAAQRQVVGELLSRASELARSRVTGRAGDRRGADLAGARLKGAGLRGASLRGACLIAADLQGADLRAADLLGADLRDTDLRGADLTGALFLTQAQINAARGDARTKLPAALTRPMRWSTTPAQSRP